MASICLLSSLSFSLLRSHFWSLCVSPWWPMMCCCSLSVLVIFLTSMIFFCKLTLSPLSLFHFPSSPPPPLPLSISLSTPSPPLPLFLSLFQLLRLFFTLSISLSPTPPLISLIHSLKSKQCTYSLSPSSLPNLPLSVAPGLLRVHFSSSRLWLP